MARLLLVEDEAMLRASVARGLARLPGVEVDAVGTVAEAVGAIDQRPPDLLLSDIDLPDRLGIELLGELAHRGLRCPVVFVSAYLRAYGPQIPPNAGVEVLEKPVSMQALRDVVQRLLASSMPDAPFSVVDYVQLACMARRSVKIELRASQPVGTILVKEGTLWAAEDERGAGASAFHRLAFRRDVRAECATLRDDPGERKIFEPWESLLMDAARFFDEANRSSPSQPSDLELSPPLSESLAPIPPMPPAPPEPPAQEDPFALVWDRGLQALLARRYDEALLAFIEARELCPDDKKVQANIARLEAMGYRAQPRGGAS